MSNGIKIQLELLNQQIKELFGIYREAVSRSGISDNEFWIWYSLLMLEGEYSQQDICNTWKLSKQTVNTIVAQMVRKGYVTLEVVPGTRNRKNICLTELGKQYGESIVLPVASAELRAFERMPAEDRNAVSVALSKYIEILKEEIHGTTKKET